MAEQSSERTQDATPHRRQQAREKGEVAFSHDLGSVAVLFAGCLAVMWLGGGLTDFFSGLLRRQLGESGPLVVNREFAVQSYDGIVRGLAKTVLPMLGVMFITAVAGTLLQIGFLFTPSRITPDIERLSPMRGFRRIASISGMMRLGFGCFKVLVVSLVAGSVICSHWMELVTLSGKETGQIASYLASILLTTMLWCGIALMILAILDYAFQRWRHERDLRMTPQEVREEMKEMQGDPLILARRRAIQRQMVMSRISDAVPKADVVITNPTELAVAIRYDPHEMAAPIVVAKGAGVLAQRIRKLALENNIPIVERKPLAQLLYKEVDINQPIPDQSYAAVAEVLAYVYQLQGRPIPDHRAA